MENVPESGKIRGTNEGTKAIRSVGMIYQVKQGWSGSWEGMNQHKQRGRWRCEKIKIKEVRSIIAAGRVTRGFTKPSAISTYTSINTIVIVMVVWHDFCLTLSFILLSPTLHIHSLILSYLFMWPLSYLTHHFTFFIALFLSFSKGADLFYDIIEDKGDN